MKEIKCTQTLPSGQHLESNARVVSDHYNGAFETPLTAINKLIVRSLE